MKIPAAFAGLAILVLATAAVAQPSADVVDLLGARPGHYGADLMPQSDDWTRVLSDIVGPQGKLCVFVPTELKDAPGDPQGRVKALAVTRPNVRPCLPPLAAKGGHDIFDFALMADAQGLLHGPAFKPADVDGFHRTLLEELKPGAPYVVLGTPKDRPAAVVRAELEAAGYVFDGERRLPQGRYALRFIKPK